MSRSRTDSADPNALTIVRRAMDRGSPEDFDELVALCGGLFPLEVADALTLLGHSDIEIPRPAHPHVTNVADSRHFLTPLALPHPLDYDWRFDQASAATLHDRALEYTGHGDTIISCGTPSVYLEGLSRPQGRLLHLHDANADAHDFHALTPTPPQSIDFTVDEPPALAADFIIADPPWYPAYNRLFLWWASQIRTENTQIALVIAPENTRPSIESERRSLWAWAETVGFELRSIEPSQVQYTTPPFEERALEAGGLTPTQSWRFGDVATLQVVSDASRERPEVEREQWKSVRSGHVDVRFRVQSSRDIDPRLISVVADDTLDSVSTRDPRRTKISVWTTLNRVYGCKHPALAHILASAVLAGVDASEGANHYVARTLLASEKAHIAEAIDQLAELFDSERHRVAPYHLTE